MAIQITRAAPGIELSVEQFDSLAEALNSLRNRGIPVTEDHAREFASHADTQFVWLEFLAAGPTEHVLARSDIAVANGKPKIRTLQSSLMPEGLESGMSVQDMADLLTFIEELK